MLTPMSDVTKLIGNVADGDARSLNQLYEAMYAELRAMAAQKMASERPGHTLQPTALVNEAYLRLGGAEGFKFENAELADQTRHHGETFLPTTE